MKKDEKMKMTELYEKEKSTFSEQGILIGIILCVPAFTFAFGLINDTFAVVGMILGIPIGIFWGNWLDVHFNKGNKMVRRIRKNMKVLK